MKHKLLIVFVCFVFLLGGCGNETTNKTQEKQEQKQQEKIELSFNPELYNKKVLDNYNYQYIDEDGALHGMGSNYFSKLGNYDRFAVYIANDNYKSFFETSEYIIKDIIIAENVKHISCNLISLIYITEDNKLYGLGTNFYGTLMDPVGDDHYGELVTTPKLLMEDVIYANITSGNVIALKKDKSVWIWGCNLDGQLGESFDGGYKDYSIEPIKIMDNAVSVSGDGTFAAIKTDGSLWMWGHNRSGEIDSRNDNQELLTQESIVCKKPKKVMDNVEFVWLNYPDRKDFDFTDREPDEHVYAQKLNGDIYYWGGDLGHNIQRYNANENVNDQKLDK